MKRLLVSAVLVALFQVASSAQMPAVQIAGKEVFKNDDVVFHQYGIKYLYPGHYFGKNVETKQRVDDLATISRDVLSGKVKGEPGGRGAMGGNLTINAYGVRVNYSERSLK